MNQQNELPPFDAVVLAGGLARRLGGIEKPATIVGDRSLLDSVLAAVDGASGVVCVGPPRPAAGPVRWVREEPAGGGPVAALAAALPCVDAPYVALLAADLPFLDSETVTRLRAAAADRDGALLVDDEGVDQVLVGVWRSSALRDALGSITGGPLRRVLGRLEPARMHVPAGPAPGAAPWFDCDTPDDLRVARARA